MIVHACHLKGCTDRDDKKCRWIEPDIGRCPCRCHSDLQDESAEEKSQPIPINDDTLDAT